MRAVDRLAGGRAENCLRVVGQNAVAFRGTLGSWWFDEKSPFHAFYFEVMLFDFFSTLPKCIYIVLDLYSLARRWAFAVQEALLIGKQYSRHAKLYKDIYKHI